MSVLHPRVVDVTEELERAEEAAAAKQKEQQSRCTGVDGDDDDDGGGEEKDKDDEETEDSSDLEYGKPFDSDDEEDERVVQMLKADGTIEDITVTALPDSEEGKQRKKKKRKKKKKKPIVGPMWEQRDAAMGAAQYVDVTPWEPTLRYGRVEGGVLKKVLRAGHGPSPPAGSIVRVKHYQVTYLQSNPRRAVIDNRKDWMKEGAPAAPAQWVFGQGSHIPALEAGIFTMRAGEKARFKVRWQYGYGENGIAPGPPFIPPRANLWIDVEMVAWEPYRKERNAMSPVEMLEEAERVKEEGNYKYREGEWAEANYIHDDVFNVIKLIYYEYIQQRYTYVRRLEAETLNNQAACYLKMGDYDMVERRTRKCLQILPTDVKALLRLGIALNEQGQHEEAKKYLKYAVAHNPQLKTLRREYNRACIQLRDQRLATKKVWKGAFNRKNKLGDLEERNKAAETRKVNERLDKEERNNMQRKLEALQQQQQQQQASALLQQQPKEQFVPRPLTVEQLDKKYARFIDRGKKEEEEKDAAMEGATSIDPRFVPPVNHERRQQMQRQEEDFERSVLRTGEGMVSTMRRAEDELAAFRGVNRQQQLAEIRERRRRIEAERRRREAEELQAMKK